MKAQLLCYNNFIEHGGSRMKLKNRLIIAFLLIAIVPMLLMSAVTLGFSHYQMKMMKENSGVQL